MSRQTGFEFVLLSHCMLLQSDEIPLFKYIAHVQFAGHKYTNKPLHVVFILLHFYHIV